MGLMELTLSHVSTHIRLLVGTLLVAWFQLPSVSFLPLAAQMRTLLVPWFQLAFCESACLCASFLRPGLDIICQHADIKSHAFTRAHIQGNVAVQTVAVSRYMDED